MVNSTSSNANYSGQKLAYGNGVFVATYNEGNPPVYVKAGSYSGTNSITFGSQIQPNTGTSHFSGGTVAYNPNANKFVFTFAENATTSIIAYLITNSGTTLTTGNSATITMGYTGNNKVIWNEYDPDTNKQVIMTDHLYSNEGRIYQASISGANITVPSTYYAITDEGTEEEGSKALSYDPDNNKWILFKAATGNVTRANVLTASGDTFTSGTVTQISSQYMRGLAPYYDTEQNKTVLVSRKNTTGYYGIIGFVTISGTTPSYTASTTTVGNQTAVRVYPHASLYNPDTKSGIVVSGFTINSPAEGMGVVLYYGTTSSTVVNGSVFAGTSLSATALELKTFPASTIVGKADGAVTAGKPVIVEADGDFAQAAIVSQSTRNQGTASQGSLGSMGTYSTDMFAMAVAKDGLTYCFTYQNTSTQQACKIGTRSGNSISWGSELVLASANSDSHFVSYNDEADVFLTTYTTGDTIKGTAVSYSGNTGTKGSEVTIMNLGGSSSSPSFHYQHWFDATNKVSVCWAKGGVSGNDTNRSSAVVITLTGTSIALGTLYENASAGGQYSKGCDITGGKHVLYWRSNSSYYPNVMTMTVTSSGAISWGTPLVINSATGSISNPIYNPIYPNKAILAGKISTANNYFSYAGLTINGTSITASNYSDGNINNAQSYVESGGNVAVYSNYSGNYCFVYQTYSPYNSRYNFATTTDGLSLTVATAVTTTAHGSSQFYAGACASDVDGTVVENHNNRSSSPGTYAYYCFNPTFDFTITTSAPNLTAENYIGIAQETVSTGNDVKVTTISGVDANQSSLTPAQTYYVQTDGTLSTTAGTPSVVAGTAIAATQLLVSRS